MKFNKEKASKESMGTCDHLVQVSRDEKEVEVQFFAARHYLRSCVEASRRRGVEASRQKALQKQSP